jgi:hypothetical protein
VAKKSDRSRSKVKEAQGASHDISGARGGRGRGGLEGRTRGRGTDRGRGARGGRASSHANGTKMSEKTVKPVQDGWGDSAAATPAEATGSWADTPTNGDAAATDQLVGDAVSKETSPKSEETKSNVIPMGKVTGWAGLFAKPAPEPAPKKTSAPAPPPAEENLPQPEEQVPDEIPEEPPTEPSSDGISSDIVDEPSSDLAITLTPSKDELTHDNLEHIPDVSQPPPTATAASTIASTQDPHSTLTSAQPATRPGMSGYATSAMKATSGTGRSSSFQRRVLEQQEAVVMPENHAVSRAAMQFGSMNISDSPESAGLDEDREEPETRTQLPDDSPIAPRASLPPPPAAQPLPAAEPAPAARPAPGLPPAPQQQSTSPPQTTAYADQFARYGQPAQRAYDTFGQQSAQQQSQAHDAFASQAPTQTQQASTSAPNDYSALYNQDAQRNISYQNYYGYGQNQEVQQRSGSAFGTTGTESQPQYATSRPQAGFGQQDAHSGNNTPNPALPGQQHQQQSQHMHQGQGSQGGYPYGYANAAYNQPYPQYASYVNQMGQQHQYGQNRPMFDDARRYDESYMSHSNQYGSYGRQYGGGHYSKSGMYNQPQQHQYSYEHSSSPANAGSFNQSSMGRDGVYGRSGSALPSESQQAAGSSAFSGMTDPFSRDQSGFGGHTPMSQQHSGQIGLDDPSKGYDPAKASGPSPSIKNAHRPGSAANNMQSQQIGQSVGLPAPQSQQGSQQAFGGYPQYGGFGANVGGHQQGQTNHPQTTQQQQQQQQQQYAGYGGSAAGFGNYGGYGSGRGWSGSYGGAH